MRYETRNKLVMFASTLGLGSLGASLFETTGANAIVTSLHYTTENPANTTLTSTSLGISSSTTGVMSPDYVIRDRNGNELYSGNYRGTLRINNEDAVSKKAQKIYDTLDKNHEKKKNNVLEITLNSSTAKLLNAFLSTHTREEILSSLDAMEEVMSEQKGFQKTL